MSYYDFIEKRDGNVDQIKAWGQSGHLYRIGDDVPSLRGEVDYTILMRKGYKVRVENCKYIGTIDNCDRNVGVRYFDTWGNYFFPGDDGRGKELEGDGPYFLNPDHVSKQYS